MNEIKAYIHTNRIAEVIRALKSSAAWSDAADAGGHNLAAYMVKGSLLPFAAHERQFSVELGDEVINEYKLELLCDDKHVEELVRIIRSTARTGQSTAGWVYVTQVLQAHRIA